MRYHELDMMEFNQNTIDDFHESTKDAIDSILDLVTIKLADFMREGEIYTRTAVMELLGSAIIYAKTFAFGGDFQGEH